MLIAFTSLPFVSFGWSWWGKGHTVSSTMIKAMQPSQLSRAYIHHLVLEQVLSTYKGLHASVLYQNKRFQLLRACISLLSRKRCQLSRAYITWLDKSNSNGPKILLVGHSQAEFFAFGLSWVQMIF